MLRLAPFMFNFITTGEHRLCGTIWCYNRLRE